MKNILVTVFSVVLLSVTYGQITPVNFDCQNARTISANTTNNFTAGVDQELWYVIDMPISSNQKLRFTFKDDNGNNVLFNYELYGPFTNAHDCSVIASQSFQQGANFSTTYQVSSQGNCFSSTTSQADHARVPLPDNSQNGEYYLLKVFSNSSIWSESISICCPSGTFDVGSATQSSTYQCSYAVNPSLTNNSCSGAINVCGNYSYNHDCNTYGNSQSIYWYSLDINTSGASVLFTSTESGTAANSEYILFDAAVNGCQDINGVAPLNTGTGGQFSYTFSSPGNYYIAYQPNTDCPEISIEIQNNTDCIECPQPNNCETLIDLSDCEYINNNGCNGCPPLDASQFWYSINIEEPGQVLHIQEFASNSSGPFDFNYAIFPEIPGVSICAVDYQTAAIQNETNVSQATYTFTEAGQYYLVLYGLTDCPDLEVCIVLPPDPCETCIGSFAPVPGEEYLIGAWVKEENAPGTKTSYDQPEIYIHYTIDTDLNDPNNPTSTQIDGPYVSSGAIIDGWQRIEEPFTIPVDAIDMEIKLSTAGADVLFDDVRVFPFDASMKTFVYDPINMRLAAELDERHYATFYEYDEEGKLVRIKKETERGVMTIQETKSNSSKQNP